MRQKKKKKLANEPFAFYMYLGFTCTYEDILYTYEESWHICFDRCT